MSQFYLKPRKIMSRVGDFSGYMARTAIYVNEVRGIGNSISDILASDSLKASLLKLPVLLEKRKEELGMLKDSLVQINTEYVVTESKCSGNSDKISEIRKNIVLSVAVIDYLQNFIAWLSDFFKDKRVGYEVQNILYDNDGRYGGDQGAAAGESRARQAELAEIAKRNNPSLDLSTPKKIQTYFRDMNEEACGYVAIANTIFAYYIGREDEFEKAFGFPMYHNGDLNYDALLVDIYSRYDDPNTSGTNPDSRKEFLEDYMKQKGVDVSVAPHQDLSTTEIKEDLRDGKHVLIAFHNGYMYDENGNRHAIDGGHSMEVTGVTKDGKLIVSSWGEKYYIDPNESVTMSDGDTWYSYEVVEYK